MFWGTPGGVLGAFLVSLGRLGGVLGEVWGSLGGPWRALGNWLAQRSKKSLFLTPFWRSKLDQKSLKVVFKNDQVFGRVSVDAFGRFVMNL